jgi:hypothetical protein
MMRGNKRKYTEAVREQYHRAPKEEGQDVDGFTKVVPCHRKTAIRLLRRGCVNSGGRGDMGSVGGACLFACTAGLC